MSYLLGLIAAIAGYDVRAHSAAAVDQQSDAMVRPAFLGRDPVDSPSLAGLPDIASEFDQSGQLATSSRTAPPASGPIGAFRFICQPGQLNWDDPILFPGKPGASPHLHQWFGNLSADGNSTYRSLRAVGESTCMGPLNRSAYWMPAMIADGRTVIRPDYLTVYYKQYPDDAAECGTIAKRCLPLPNGLRYVFGFDMQRVGKSQGEVSRHLHWKCVAPGNRQRGPSQSDFSRLQCEPGDLLIATLAAPDCWDGRRLDSPDHRAHMAYPYYDGTRALPVCPSTHPYLVPQFTLGATWRLRPGDVLENWHLASDRMPGMPQLPSGASFHSDWFGAWDPETIATWTRNCINRRLTCVDGELGDGSKMKRPPGYSLVVEDRTAPIPPRDAADANHHPANPGPHNHGRAKPDCHNHGES